MADAIPIPTDPRFQDLRGRRFGRLRVTAYAGRRNARHYWLCRCRCGLTTTVRGSHLLQKLIESCRCLQKERLAASHRTHGKAASAEYRIWCKMIQRCCNPKAKEWARYGGRGIKVCRRWRHSFANFLADMGPRPSAAHQIDRHPNNDGPYRPGNCRWATRTQQARNRRSNRLVELDGERRTLTEWAERFERNPLMVQKRLNRGWSPHDALVVPPGGKGNGRFRKGENARTRRLSRTR